MGRKERRREAPKHITLPSTPNLRSPDGSSEVPFTHMFPSTPATRSSLSPGSELRPNQNPFFILNEESPAAPIYPAPSSSTPKLARRPALSAEISLEHAFGDTRAKRDPDSDPSATRYQHTPPRTPGRPKEISIPSPIFSRSPSRSSAVSQPELSSKPKKSRPRSSTVLSEQRIRRSLDTPSFRSAACTLPLPGTPREISISEVPVMMSGELGCAVDIFGLAALQPPRISIRPRPRARYQPPEGSPLSTTSSEGVSPATPPEPVADGLAVTARTASPVNS